MQMYKWLNRFLRESFEGGRAFARLRGHPYVELVHVLHQSLAQSDSDLHRILRHSTIDFGRLDADFTTAIDRLPRGATALGSVSSQLEEASRQAWLVATVDFGDNIIRSAYLFVAILRSPDLRTVIRGITHCFDRIDIDQVGRDLTSILAGSPEGPLPAGKAEGTAGRSASGRGPSAVDHPADGADGGSYLSKFAVNLTERVRRGEVDPVVGRDKEIRQCIDILVRRRQNNPILTGEAGVGKTAVVEGLAIRIGSGDVPPKLQNVELWALDIGLLQAGAGAKGEFEYRLKQVVGEVQATATPSILFVDEAHMLVGAGGAAGQSDAANLLKPALARGAVRMIAATTWAEYRKYFETDQALTRRFQVVKVNEPEEDLAVVMVRSLAKAMAVHHDVQILDEAVEAAVRLSKRYLPGRQLPDKAVSLLDTACARVAVSQHAVPGRVEDARRRLAAIQAELDAHERDLAMGFDRSARRAAVNAAKQQVESQLAEIERKFEEERRLVSQILANQQTGVFPTNTERSGTTQEKLEQLRSQLRVVQGDHPLVLANVDAQAVAAVVSDWTGIPLGKMMRDEFRAIRTLADTLELRVKGQRHALEEIAAQVRTARAQLGTRDDRPTGVFLLVGPSGVGKTETAHGLAEALFGGESGLITINMSEFQEKHTISTLKGAPPGYVGYGEGGVLTEAVRRRPYCVVLLDEFEKAHPSIHRLFLQVFDTGRMEDGQGREIDFKNTLILLTSNVGQERLHQLHERAGGGLSPDAAYQALRAPLSEAFPSELLGRLRPIVYLPLADDVLREVVTLQLSRVQAKLRNLYDVVMTFDATAIEQIAQSCRRETGARAVDAILSREILPAISSEILGRLSDGRSLRCVHMKSGPDGFAFDFE